ncbi:hypothetical protein Tco_0574648, partial [Tanacetum coccineum]
MADVARAHGGDGGGKDPSRPPPCNDPLRKGGRNVIIMVSYQSIIKA